MNCSIYLFGITKKGYMQYPDDYTNELFHTFIEQGCSDSDIIVHRDKNLMYYSYVRKLQDDKTLIGITAIINGLRTVNIKSVFKLFEKTFEDMVLKGEILKFGDDGKIQFFVDSFGQKPLEIQRVCNYIKTKLEEGEDRFEGLPPVSYASDINEYKKFSLEDETKEILEALDEYDNVLISKRRNIGSSEFNGYQIVIARQYDEIQHLELKVQNLEQQLSTARREKRACTLFSIVAIILVIAVVAYGFYKLYIG